jgi:hypothetical protein
LQLHEGLPVPLRELGVGRRVVERAVLAVGRDGQVLDGDDGLRWARVLLDAADDEAKRVAERELERREGTGQVRARAGGG